MSNGATRAARSGGTSLAAAVPTRDTHGNVLANVLADVIANVPAIGLAIALATVPMTSQAFSDAMPRAPSIGQGSIANAVAARSDQAARLEPLQQLGAALPLDTPLIDWQGHGVVLGRYFSDKPVVLVLGYYQCPNLCGTVMHGVLEALSATGLPASAWRIVYVSVDPGETAGLAASRRATWLDYLRYLDDSGGGPRAIARPVADHPASVDMSPQLETLVGDARATASIARAAGFAIEPDAPSDSTRPSATRSLSRYAHAAEFMIATPDGHLSRYELGVRYDPRDLRLALVDAGQGRIGNVVDRLVLLCSHFDPETGRYNGAVMNLLRGVGIATALGLSLFAWRHRQAGPRDDRDAAA